MNIDNVLILESSSRARLQIAESLSERSDMSFRVVGTVENAIAELQKGIYGRFRTNFINDDLPLGQGPLYASEAIALAISSGVITEVWTVNTLKETAMLAHILAPDFEGHVDFYSKLADAHTWFTQDEVPYKAGGNAESGRSSSRKEV